MVLIKCGRFTILSGWTYDRVGAIKLVGARLDVSCRGGHGDRLLRRCEVRTLVLFDCVVALLRKESRLALGSEWNGSNI